MTKSLAPWVGNPRRLWSLWDMLEKHCGLFVAATNALAEAKWVAIQTDVQGADSPKSRGQIAALGNHAIGLLREASILSDMDGLMPEIDRLADSLIRLRTIQEYKIDTVAHSIKHLISRIKDDLSSQYYFHMDMKDVPLFHSTLPFGAKVSTKFPKAIEDIEEAAKCLALQRSTACVFHLMRVMESGVQRLGKKMKISLNPSDETWYQIMEHVDGAIKKLPAKKTAEKKRKTELGAASANLNAVRIATRNEVMHPKQTYTREQAHDVYNATRAFMEHLSTLI